MNCNRVTVLLFTISDETNNTTFGVSVKNVWCYDYFAMSKSSDTWNDDFYYVEFDYGVTADNFIIAAYDRDYTSLIYSENTDYAISDVRYATKVYNTGHLNELIDADYEPENDYGSFIIGTLYEGSGGYQAYIPYSEGLDSKQADAIAGALYSLSAELIMVVIPLSTGLSFAYTMGAAAYDIFSIVDNSQFENQIYTSTSNVIPSSNKDFSYVTRSSQLNETTGYGGLVKDSVLIDHNTSNSTQYGFILPKNGYTKATFVISQGELQNQNADWRNNINFSVDLKIARLDSDQITYLDSDYFGDNYFSAQSTVLFRDTYDKLEIENGSVNQNIYVLPNYTSKYQFTPTCSGKYSLNFGNGTGLTTTLTNGNTTINSTNGYYDLIAGCTYYLDIVSSNSTITKTTLNITPKALTVGSAENITIPGNSYYLCKASSLNGAYSIFSTNSDIKVAKIDAYSTTNSNVIDNKQYFFEATGEKYIWLYNSSSVSKTTSVKLSSIQVLALDNTSPTGITVEAGEYYALRLSGNYGCYNFTLGNANVVLKQFGQFSNNISESLDLTQYDYIYNISNTYLWVYNNYTSQVSTTITVATPATVTVENNQFSLSNINGTYFKINKIDLNNNINIMYYMVEIPFIEGQTPNVGFYDLGGNQITAATSAFNSSTNKLETILLLPEVFYINIKSGNLSISGASATFTITDITGLGYWSINDINSDLYIIDNYVSLYKGIPYAIRYKVGTNLTLDWACNLSTSYFSMTEENKFVIAANAPADNFTFAVYIGNINTIVFLTVKPLSYGTTSYSTSIIDEDRFNVNEGYILSISGLQNIVGVKYHTSIDTTEGQFLSTINNKINFRFIWNYASTYEYITLYVESIVVDNIANNTADYIYYSSSLFGLSAGRTISIRYTSGSGTSSNPYRISNSREFNNIYLNTSSYFKQTQDIDFYNNQTTRYVTFSGTYNGDYNSIYGVCISGTFSRNSVIGGLFDTNNGTVKNFTIHVDMDVTSSGLAKLGGIIGYNTGTMSACFVYGTINTNTLYCGDCVGYNKSTGTLLVVSSYAVTVNSNDYAFVGTVMGMNYGSYALIGHFVYINGTWVRDDSDLFGYNGNEM